MVSYSKKSGTLQGGVKYQSDSFPDTFQSGGLDKANRAMHRAEYMLDINTDNLNTSEVKYFSEITAYAIVILKLFWSCDCILTA